MIVVTISHKRMLNAYILQNKAGVTYVTSQIVLSEMKKTVFFTMIFMSTQQVSSPPPVCMGWRFLLCSIVMYLKTSEGQIFVGDGIHTHMKATLFFWIFASE